VVASLLQQAQPGSPLTNQPNQHACREGGGSSSSSAICRAVSSTFPHNHATLPVYSPLCIMLQSATQLLNIGPCYTRQNMHAVTGLIAAAVKQRRFHF
jgi:hypothetical protein